jgi:hypothetical protein
MVRIDTLNVSVHQRHLAKMTRDSVAKQAVVRVADRRLEARYDGAINGSYTLSSRRIGENGLVQVFACRCRSISASAASITAPVNGEEGELITVRLDGLGIMRGRIDRPLEDGFVFAILASGEQRRKLAGRIDWLKRRSGRPAADRRSYQRQQPADPRSTITLADGHVLRCFVMDYSRSGAAVSADHLPAINAQVVLGALAARVVRHLDVGFSVKFDAVQDGEGLEDLITGFEPGPGTGSIAAAARALRRAARPARPLAT